MPTDEELRQPQRFPLTDDGLVTARVKESGPLNGGSIDDELAVARYRDWEYTQGRLSQQHTERSAKMPDLEADRQADAYWNSKIQQSRQADQNAQAQIAGQTQAASVQPRNTETAEQRQVMSI